MKRKPITVIAAVAGIACIAASVWFGTLAYQTDSEQLPNMVTLSENKTEIHEEFTPPDDIHPGANEYQKSISVVNVGDIDTYVRVMFRFDNQVIQNWSGVSCDGTTFYSACEDGTPAGVYGEDITGIKADSFLNHLPEGWVYISENDGSVITYQDESYNLTSTKGELLGGYFYYTGILSPGESTSALTQSIKTYFKRQADVKPYDIIVYEESIETVTHEAEPITGADAWLRAWVETVARKTR